MLSVKIRRIIRRLLGVAVSYFICIAIVVTVLLLIPFDDLNESTLNIILSEEFNLEESLLEQKGLLPRVVIDFLLDNDPIVLSVILSLGVFILYEVFFGISFSMVILLILAIFDYLAAKYTTSLEYKWPFLHLLFVLVVSRGIYSSYRHAYESSERRLLQRAFGKYINRDLVNLLRGNPDALSRKGKQRFMTILFSDIRGFTSFCEKIKPKILVRLLNDYLERMSKVIHKYDGTIDKFIGDAIMVFWNAPLLDKFHATKSVKAALDMIQKSSKKRKKKGRKNFKIGIGINTGAVIVGNIGSRRKFDYTVLGDQVNLASRLEGLTKKYDVDIIISECTLKKIFQEQGVRPGNVKGRVNADVPAIRAPRTGTWYSKERKFYDPNSIVFRYLDKVIVKGRKEALKIFEPLKSTERSRKIVKYYNKGLKLYRKKRFDEAIENLSVISKFDKPSRNLINRIRKYTYPDDWDGTWYWDEK